MGAIDHTRVIMLEPVTDLALEEPVKDQYPSGLKEQVVSRLKLT